MIWLIGVAAAWWSLPNLVAAQGQCYFPPETQGQLGFQATEQKPCDAFAEVSLCCPLGWTCFSNKLCVVTDSSAVGGLWPLGTALRGTCTNPVWDNGSCGDFCLNDPVQQNNGSLEYCGDGSWCCGPAANDGSCDCQNKRGSFSVGDGIAQTIIGVTGLDSTSTFFTPAFTTPATQSSSRATSTGSSRTSSISTKPSSSSTSASTSSKASNQSKTSTPTSSHVSSTGDSSPTAAGVQKSVPVTQNTAFKAGIGVLAGIIGLAVIALVVLLFWRRARNQRRSHLPAAGNDDDDSIIDPQYYPPPPMFRHDPDPYMGGNIPIPPRSPARGSPNRGSPVRGAFGSEMREVQGNSRPGRSPSPNVDPYIMPYEGT